MLNLGTIERRKMGRSLRGKEPFFLGFYGIYGGYNVKITLKTGGLFGNSRTEMGVLGFTHC